MAVGNTSLSSLPLSVFSLVSLVFQVFGLVVVFSAGIASLQSKLIVNSLSELMDFILLWKTILAPNNKWALFLGHALREGSYFQWFQCYASLVSHLEAETSGKEPVSGRVAPVFLAGSQRMRTGTQEEPSNWRFPGNWVE